MIQSKFAWIFFTPVVMCNCATLNTAPPYVPSKAYSDAVRARFGGTTASGPQGAIDGLHRLPSAAQGFKSPAASVGGVAAVSLVSGATPEDQVAASAIVESVPMPDHNTAAHDPYVLTREYEGPLSLGEPGVSPSLFREGRGANDLWKDIRAWQPLDLLTIVIDEKSKGKKSADTEVKQKSDLTVGLAQLFGLEKEIPKKLTNIGDTSKLVTANTQLDFKGQGDTSREDSLSGNISAMVVEVLPSGILRVEGQKILAVNSEEQVMIISGLVRPRDISSDNSVTSSKIANMRIDYYGRGTVDDAQHGGWGTRLLRTLWPF